jgi:two-component system, OmpR family, phosphate regulon sensor histidine kinase PhoR
VTFLFLAVASVFIGSAVFLMSNDGSAAGLATIASFGSGAVVQAMATRKWRLRADAYAAAARGVMLERIDLAPGSHDPARLATEVKTSFDSAQLMSSKVSQLNLVIDGLAEGVWLTDRNGVVLEHNPAVEKIAGQSLVGTSVGEAFPELLQPVLRACQSRADTRLELERPGLRKQILSVHVAPLARNAGSSAVFFDITELRRLEEVRRDFVANVSHELRTPLTAMRGYAETLQLGALNDPAVAPGMIDIIHRQAVRLSELVDDLLQLSKLESKALVFDLQPVLIAEVATRALESLSAENQARFDMSVDQTQLVSAHERSLEQVLVNLFENAVRHSGSQQIAVKTEIGAGHVFVLIEDFGVGISAAHLPRLFERFYRVDAGRSRDAGGTGLGLAIVKHLCQAMKAEVSVTSQLGAGTTFTVKMRKWA